MQHFKLIGPVASASRRRRKLLVDIPRPRLFRGSSTLSDSEAVDSPFGYESEAGSPASGIEPDVPYLPSSCRSSSRSRPSSKQERGVEADDDKPITNATPLLSLATQSSDGVDEITLNGKPDDPLAKNKRGKKPKHHTGYKRFVLFRSSWDHLIRRKTALITLNGMIGLILMIVMQQVCWTGTECEANLGVFSLKWIIFGSTLLLLYQLLDRSRVEIVISQRESVLHIPAAKSHHGKAVAKEGRAKEQQQKLAAEGPPISIFAPFSWFRAASYWTLWLQLVVCAIVPIPSVHPSDDDPAFNKVGLLMFVRLHLLARYIRDFSLIWRSRHMLARSAYRSRNAPRFSWWLSVKTLAYQHPELFFILSMTTLVSVFGYCIYVLEREIDPDNYTFWNSLYLAVQSFVTGYGSDNFDVYVPTSKAAQLVCLCSTFSGLLFVSFIIGMFCDKVFPSNFEKQAVVLLQRNEARKQEAIAAASLIQLVWRSYKRCSRIADDHAASSPNRYERLYEREERAFMERFVEYAKTFRDAQRERKRAESHYHEQFAPPTEEVLHDEMHKLQSSLEATMHNHMSMRRTLNRILERLDAQTGSASHSGTSSSTSSASSSSASSHQARPQTAAPFGMKSSYEPGSKLEGEARGAHSSHSAKHPPASLRSSDQTTSFSHSTSHLSASSDTPVNSPSHERGQEGTSTDQTRIPQASAVSASEPRAQGERK